METQVREQKQTTLLIGTSQLAYQKFLAEGKVSEHHNIIIKTLQKFPYLSNWGISKKSELSYHQVGRRTGELREKGIIKEVARLRDADGAIRMQYTLI